MKHYQSPLLVMILQLLLHLWENRFFLSWPPAAGVGNRASLGVYLERHAYLEVLVKISRLILAWEEHGYCRFPSLITNLPSGSLHFIDIKVCSLLLEGILEWHLILYGSTIMNSYRTLSIIVFFIDPMMPGHEQPKGYGNI